RDFPNSAPADIAQLEIVVTVIGVRATDRRRARSQEYRRYRCRRHIPTENSRNRPRRGGAAQEQSGLRPSVPPLSLHRPSMHVERCAHTHFFSASLRPPMAFWTLPTTLSALP